MGVDVLSGHLPSAVVLFSVLISVRPGSALSSWSAWLVLHSIGMAMRMSMLVVLVLIHVCHQVLSLEFTEPHWLHRPGVSVFM